MQDTTVKQCCAAFYGSDLARTLLGDSFHPGGVRLTRRIGDLLGLTPASHVLDVAAGRGTSALCLAREFGCHVTGIDLSDQNIAAARTEADTQGMSDRVRFQLADAERLPFLDASLDAIVCECAFCTFPGKGPAAAEFARVLKPGGAAGISDLTRTEAPLPELNGLLAWIACIGDALPLQNYSGFLEGAGLCVEVAEAHDDALGEMVRDVQSRLLGMEIATGLGKLQIPGLDLGEAKRFAGAASAAIRQGQLGYAILIARRPAKCEQQRGENLN
jgi:arsenite methyltransferase